MRSDEKYFSFVEQEGVDRRHAVLEITVHETNGGFHGEVFDVITGQTVWLGSTETEETEAYLSAEIVLDALENINGFGAISLYE